MKRKFLSVLLILVLACSFSLVTAVPVAAQDSVPDRVTAITTTADRLVDLQSTTDYGWDHIVTGLTQHSAIPSAYNMYGVVILGLLDAYGETDTESYLAAATGMANHMTNTLEGSASEGEFHKNGVEKEYAGAYDYQFLMRYAEVSGNPAYGDYAIALWAWDKANTDMYATPGALNDELLIWGYGSADPGAASWMLAAYGTAIHAMGDDTFATGCANLIVADLDPEAGQEYLVGDHMALAECLEFLSELDSATYSSTIERIITDLVEAQQADGCWNDGVAGTFQDTAYAVRALAVYGGTDGLNAARKGAAWLIANQLPNGGWLDASGGSPEEYSEQDAEGLRALVATEAPVTIGEDGYYSIQSAIDSATDFDTINVAAGTYYEAVVIEKQLTLLGAQHDVDPTVEGARLDKLAESVIDAGGVTAPLWTDAVVRITAASVSLNGFTVENGNKNGIFSTAPGCTISNNIIVENSRDGIGKGGGSVFENNVISNNGGGGAFFGTGGNILRNNVISYNRDSGWTGQIGIQSDDNIVEGNTINGDSSYIASDPAYGIMVLGGYKDPRENNILRGNIINYGESGPGFDYGIAIGLAKNTLMEDNTIHNNVVGLGVFQDADTTFLRGNDVQGNECGLKVGSTYGDTKDTTIEENDVLNNDVGIIIRSAIAASTTHINLNKIVDNTDHGVLNEVSTIVDATNNYWGDASGPDDDAGVINGSGDKISTNVGAQPWYATATTREHVYVTVKVGETEEVRAYSDTIHGGIDAAVDDDTVIAVAGTYNEQVVIDKQLTLEGANPDVNAVTGERGSESIIDGGTSTALVISANDVIVDGFTLDGGITLDDLVNFINGGAISNNIITGADNSTDPPKAQNGIRVGWDNGLGVDGVTIENNTISNSLEKGIRFANTKEYDLPQHISNITISGNEIKDNGSAGIETYGPGPNTIIKNTISGNDGNGLNLKFGSGDVVTENIITNNPGGCGITLRQATDTLVENNSVSGHTSAEVVNTCPDVIGGKGSGIHIFDASENNTIRRNDISGNNYGIFIHSKGDLQPSGNSITYNDIAGNSNYGILNALVDPPAPVDVTLNWWGHASGPNRELTNGNWVGKKGDKVSENVNYKPWLHKSKGKIVPTKKPAYAQSVVLDKTGAYGWNTFSAPIFLDEEADTWAELYLADELDYSLAYRFDSDNQTFVPLLVGDDYAINPGEGFFIKMNDVGSLTILYSTEEKLMPPTRPLTAGWNLIGLANLEEMDVEDAFASIAEAPGIAGYSQVVSPTGNINPGAVLADGTIYVGESYWVYMLGARTLAGFSLTPVDWEE